MRSTRAILLAGSAIAVLFGIPVSEASCVGPAIGAAGRVDDRTIRVVAGQSLDVVGRYWTPDCNDVWGSSSCIFGGSEGPPPSRPMREISITLHLGVDPDSGAATGLVLASDIDADRRLKFTRTIRIPAGLTPGSYRLLASSGNHTTWDPLILIVR